MLTTRKNLISGAEADSSTSQPATCECAERGDDVDNGDSLRGPFTIRLDACKPEAEEDLYLSQGASSRTGMRMPGERSPSSSNETESRKDPWPTTDPRVHLRLAPRKKRPTSARMVESLA